MSSGPRIGKDEWVAREHEQRQRRSGLLGRVESAQARTPWWAFLSVFVVLACLVPVVTSDSYIQRVAFDTTIFMLLALGLNVVVGWGGLLDLGYVAFFGFGAYLYAILSSSQFDIHVPTIAVIPVVALAGALLGFVVGLPSWRLVGDYLAIVTLFALQIFRSVLNNGHDIFGANVTNGVNGILKVDPLSWFGHALPVSHKGLFNADYLYVAIGFFVVVYVALRFVNTSRTGRAWRALREDPLAATSMGMPIDWLKLMAFAFGAGIAALTGTLTASVNAAVFPDNFDVPQLITIYAMVILGGAGSQAGAIVGAVVVNVMLEALRSPDNSRWVFYIAVLLALLPVLRSLRRYALLVAATVAFGFAAHAIAGAIDPAWTHGAALGGGLIARGIAHWAIVPQSLGATREASYVLLIAAVLAVVSIRGRWKLVALVPTLYLASFVWENVLGLQPEITRYILLGAILVGVMTTRPAGILGERRVEIV